MSSDSSLHGLFWVERGRAGSLPYSKGLMAASITATGVEPEIAYALSIALEARLKAEGLGAIDADALAELAAADLAARCGEEAARRYRAWRRVRRAPLPTVVLLGGVAGTGKSTIATRLASRLDITRVIPTDAIREVMRSFVPRALVPELHRSSFEVGVGEEDGIAAVLRGFRRQAAAVESGVASLIDRMVRERRDAIVEGVHVLPAIAAHTDVHREHANVVTALLVLEDEEVHRSHFLSRLDNEHGRNPQRYLERFSLIRRMQEALWEDAERLGVPRIDAADLDEALHELVDLVVDRATVAGGG